MFIQHQTHVHVGDGAQTQHDTRSQSEADQGQGHSDSQSIAEQSVANRASLNKCHCGKRLKKHHTNNAYWMCHGCWALQDDSEYFQCGDTPNCQNYIGDCCFDVCAKCVRARGQSDIDAQQDAHADPNAVVFRKLTAALIMISSEYLIRDTHAM